jgi:hypothetical protein
MRGKYMTFFQTHPLNLLDLLFFQLELCITLVNFSKLHPQKLLDLLFFQTHPRKLSSLHFSKLIPKIYSTSFLVRIITLGLVWIFGKKVFPKIQNLTFRKKFLPHRRR